MDPKHQNISKPNRLLAALPRRVPYFVIFVLVGALHLFGALWPLDRLTIDLGFKLSQRAPSGHLVLVEFDPWSLRKLDVWPWPRSIHAKAIRKLVEDGASEIGYDVDFSARSTPAEDKALTEALDAAGSTVILPAFRQRGAPGAPGGLKSYDTLPRAEFREHAQLGNVTFRPSSDGLIRTSRTTEPWKGGAVPAMSALLVGPGALKNPEFMMDFGIDLRKVPRYPMVDLIEGKVPPAAIKGKKVLVGSAATELGDQHAVPLVGRMHGIEIQALAFESLVQGRALVMLKPVVVAALLLLLSVGLGPRFETWTWKRNLAAGVVLVALVEGIALGVQKTFPAVIPTTGLSLVIVLSILYSTYRDLWMKAIVVFRQRMHLTHQRAFIEQVMENGFDGILVTDTEGRVVTYNRAAIRLLGLQDADLATLWIGDLLPESGVDLLRPPPEGVLHDENRAAGPMTVRLEGQGKGPGAGDRYLEFVRGSFLRQSSRSNGLERRTGPRVFHTFTFRDVTERMNRELRERAEKDRAVEQSRAKSEMLASMSHELRTPLNAIMGFAEVMRSESIGPLTAVYRSYADGIHESGRRLLTLIEDVLAVSMVEAGQFALEEELFNVDMALDQCTEIYQSWPDAEHRTFVAERPHRLPMMFGSRRLVRQCVLNLLNNALKFSAEGDTVTLRAWREAEGDLIIEVEDTGMGVKSEHLGNLTQPFFRVARADTAQDRLASGLGLSLVEAYMVAHDGDLSISSELGKGTKARLRFDHRRLTRDVEDPSNDSATGTGPTLPAAAGPNVIGFPKRS